MMTLLDRRATVVLIAYLVLALAEQLAGARHWHTVDTVLVALLMPVLAIFVLLAGGPRGRLTGLAVAALFLSWLGDTVGGVALLIKIGLFLLAQLVYVVAFWPDRRRSVLRRPGWLVGYLLCLAAAIVLVARLAGGFAPAVVVYGCALAAMVVLASGVNRATAIGGILFVISDLSLATGLFATGRWADHLGFVVMPTYLAAQLLLVWGMLREQRRRAESVGAAAAPAASIALDR